MALLLVAPSILANQADSAHMAEILRASLTKLAASLASLKSYEAEATLRVTSSEAFLRKFVPEEQREDGKSGVYRVSTLAVNDRIMVRRDRLDADGKSLGSEACYIGSKGLVYKTVDGESTAVLKPSERGGNDIVRYLDSVFLCYGFLSVGAAEGPGEGFVPLRVSTLSDETVWNDIATAIKTVGSESNGRIWAEFERAGSKTIVDFVFDPELRVYLPKRLKEYSTEGMLRSQVEVAEFSVRAGSIAIPNRVKLDTFFALPGNKEPLHVCTWEYEVKKFTVNQEIDEAGLAFDPVSVDRLWDESAGKWIAAPR